MRFNPKALALFAAVCLLVTGAATSGGSWVYAAEAVTSVLIVLSVMGFFRGRQRAG